MKKLAIMLGTLFLSALMAQFAWAGGGLLLVDDDLSCVEGGGFYDVQSYYTEALKAARMDSVGAGEALLRGQYEVYEVTEDNGPDGPPLSKLQDYEIVIWFTGTTCGEFGCLGGKCITDTDEDTLRAYLEGGGKLFLSAQDYMNDFPYDSLTNEYSFHSGDFPYDCLKIQKVTVDQWLSSGFVAKGDSNNLAITEGLSFQLWNPFTKANLAIDKIESTGKGNPAYEFYIDDGSMNSYTGLSWDQMGISYQGPAVFFSSICFAALWDETGTDNTKAHLMSLILSHFYGDYADYGDAPDPPYPSLWETTWYTETDTIENAGVRHVNPLTVKEWLGDVDSTDYIDLEFNSKQVNQDEFDDGVIFNKPYSPGETGSVDVEMSVTQWNSSRYGSSIFKLLYLDAWFDWNQDGDWDDDMENVCCMFTADASTWGKNSHVYNITFPVPSWATNNDMWTRFRLAYAGSYNEYWGELPYGEVEDYFLGHPLSVGLSTFYASAGDGQATLYWSTESETNNLGFYLMRSTDGVNFERVNQDLISGHGTSEVRHDYSYVDVGLTNGVTYSYKVVDVDLAGVRTAHGPIQVTPQASVAVPTEYALSQNYPNPFNSQTAVSYAIPTAAHVSLKVFNVMGEEVRTLVDADQQANTYQVTWDGRDASGKRVASGVYFCNLKAGEFSASTKMVFMK